MVCCHQGAEGPLKKDAAAQGWRLAFSRPGFVTFKHDSNNSDLELLSGVFARTVSWSIGRVSASHTKDLASQIVSLVADAGLKRPLDALHVWARDRLPAGEHSYEPGIEPLTSAVAEALEGELVAAGTIARPATNQVLEIGDSCLDCVQVDPDSWMIGWHPATSFPPSRWPGGFPPLPHDHDAISRAYFKAAEALMWSGLPVKPDDVVVEIGSAPGGAAQRLLELGLRVIGVDPADMDPEVMQHPHFRHVRARGEDIKRAEYRDARWLLVDSNVRPDRTLLTVEQIVTNRQVDLRGLVLTLKLGTYNAAHRIPGWCHKMAGWGYKRIEARQLATGRCEVCIVARRT
jgi:23S rRNA (cytidine2498-2'-O)-methyltransferase